MKNPRSCLAMVAIAVLPTLPGLAGERYQIVTSAFLFKQGDFHSVRFSTEESPGDGGVRVIHSPATLAFDGNSLTLRGADFSWSAGAPPRPFSRIGLPAMAVMPGRTAKIRSVAPLQYLEKQDDGSLKVRDIRRDSPDAPHCHLTLTLQAPTAADGALRLACDLDLTAVSGRAAIPGVNLDVGRPVLASFKDRIDLEIRPDEWAAIQLQAAQGGEERLLLLVAAVLVRDVKSPDPTFPTGPDPYGWTGQGTPLPDSHQNF